MHFSAIFDRFDAKNLRLRVVSSLILAPITLFVVYLGGFTYDALITAVLALGLFEWLRMVESSPYPPLVGTACLMLVAAMVAAILFSAFAGLLLTFFLTLCLYILATPARRENARKIALGLPYMACSGLALIALRHAPGHGRSLLFFLLITVWATDVGAFAFGRLIGGPKLAPSISPSKTWAGLFGGMASALILGYFAAVMLGSARPAMALLLAPILAAVAQLGDLFESWVKRRSGVKDSGDLIPGHGGVLDRIDGLVAAAMFAAIFEYYVSWW